MSSPDRSRTAPWASCWLLLAAVWSGAAPAAPFEVAVAPLRFELTARAGARLGHIMEVQNVGTEAGHVAVRTLDWTYGANGGISFHEELRPGSCRPWVTLERRQLRIAARNRVTFRFQVEVPEGTPRSECRFMIAVESIEPAFTGKLDSTGANFSLPVSGRIAVAVYVAVNGAEPKLVLTSLDVSGEGAKRAPTITLSNTGDAHGRLDGSLDAVDASGQKLELVPDASPIMPGQTRTIPLKPRAVGEQKLREITYPVKATGRLDWGAGSFKIDTQLR